MVNLPDPATIPGLRAANATIQKRYDKERQRALSHQNARDELIVQVANITAERDAALDRVADLAADLDRERARNARLGNKYEGGYDALDMS